MPMCSVRGQWSAFPVEGHDTGRVAPGITTVDAGSNPAIGTKFQIAYSRSLWVIFIGENYPTASSCWRIQFCLVYDRSIMGYPVKIKPHNAHTCRHTNYRVKYHLNYAPFVYRLGHDVLSVEKRVRPPHGVPLKSHYEEPRHD